MNWTTQPLATIKAAFLPALLGLWIGACASLASFKERYFERHLRWYEQISLLHNVPHGVDVATILQRKGLW